MANMFICLSDKETENFRREKISAEWFDYDNSAGTPPPYTYAYGASLGASYSDSEDSECIAIASDNNWNSPPNCAVEPYAVVEIDDSNLNQVLNIIDARLELGPHWCTGFDNQSSIDGGYDANYECVDNDASLQGYKENYDVTCNGTGADLDSKYWLLQGIDGTGSTTDYYAWYDVDNNSNDPGLDYAEITDITINTDGAGSEGNYFTISSPTDTFYVWYYIAATPTPDPNPNPAWTGIQVTILAADTIDQVATKTATAIDANADFSCPAPGAATITITNTANGSANNATAGTSGFTVSIQTQGQTAVAALSGKTGIEIDIASGDTSNQVADKSSTAINAEIEFTASYTAGNVFTVENANIGEVVNASNENAYITISINTEGREIHYSGDEYFRVRVTTSNTNDECGNPTTHNFGNGDTIQFLGTTDFNKEFQIIANDGSYTFDFRAYLMQDLGLTNPPPLAPVSTTLWNDGGYSTQPAGSYVRKPANESRRQVLYNMIETYGKIT